MGRHTKAEQPDDEPAPHARAPQGPYYGAPPGPSYDVFPGQAGDRAQVPPYEHVPAGLPFGAERQNGPPAHYRFEPFPGDYPGDIPGAPKAHLTGALGRPLDPPPAQPPASSGTPGGRSRRVGVLSVLPVPMLPIVALVIAVGVVAYALSTQQISLNFAGGAPARDTQTDPRDNQVSQRGPGARADGLVVAFRVASRTPGGFKATATIANKGSQPVTGWALAFRIQSASVTAVRGATVVRTGRIAFVRGRTAIAPGETVRIVFAARGTPARPASCILNSRPCALV